MEVSMVILAVLGGIILYVIGIHNGLNRKKLKVEQAWSNIETFEQERLDDLESQFAQMERAFDHEASIQTDIAKYRSHLKKAMASGSPNDMVEADNMASGFLRNFTFEDYPDLKAFDQSIFVAQETALREKDISAARRLYNYNVTAYNMALKNFPSNLFAGMFGHDVPYPLFEADPRAHQRPKLVHEDYYQKVYDQKLKGLDEE